jgi:hypothetical protein
MALVSPGVEVTVIDNSQYLPAPTNSVPFFLFATAQNKANPNGTGVAEGTTAANAGKLYNITSQRDLVTIYGNPFFYTNANGTPIQGYELNEYGLLAAYSALGVTNQAYTLRADIDLASLVGQTARPVGLPAEGSYWLDTTTSTWGIYEWNATTATFTNKIPIVITDSTFISAGFPVASLGSVGSYAVNAIASSLSRNQYFYKNSSGSWVALGSADWYNSWPTVQGTVSSPSLTAAETFTIQVLNTNNSYTVTIAVPAGPNNTVAGVAAAINALSLPEISASVSSNKLNIFSAQLDGDPAVVCQLVLADVSGTPLVDMGITPGTYNQPLTTWATAPQQPLWSSSQTYPRPTGSVWLKAGGAGNGFVQQVSAWNSTISSWVPKTVSNAVNDWAAIAALDSTGGQAIPANTVYAQYDADQTGDDMPIGAITLWKRIATGETIVTGTNTSPLFNSTNCVGAGPYTLLVYVSLPSSTTLSSAYTVTIPNAGTATDFVNSWVAAGIPYTTVEETSDGALQITHTEGGVIIVDDTFSSGADKGKSNGVMDEAGFVLNTTDGVKNGPFAGTIFTATQSSTTGSGTGLILEIANLSGVYTITFINAGGASHVVGDQITFNGANLGGATPGNNCVVEVIAVSGGAVTEVAFISGSPADNRTYQLSNWYSFDYEANEGAPFTTPANNTNWYYSVVNQVDIMVQSNGQWNGYKNINYDSNGFPTPSGVNATDPNGPIISASEPTTQSDNTALVYGDLWVDTSDLENYPVIYRWQSVSGEDKWVLIDNTDQVSGNGIVFADARWATNGTTNPANDPIPTIVSLLSSDYLDLDAPEADLYPTGMLLFNTRRSGFNVKQYKVNYFNSVNFPDTTLPTEKDAWVSQSGLQSNGAPYMGRKAQRNMVVQSLRSAIDTNLNIRDEDFFFNLITCPNYPELQPNMVVLNADRGETAFIVGDTPMRLADTATAIEAWANNAAGATSTGEDGLVTRSTYMGLFYPSGITSDLSGNLVAVPPSHMMTRTILRNDQIAFPWFAPAGTRRGIIDNATNIGYLNSETGEFVTTRTRIGIRDVLYTNFINPLVFFTGNGLLNYGNKSSFNSQSALDRINVARLVAFIRRQLTILARPFVFEPNDAFTRGQISTVTETLMNDLVTNRGIYDYSVVCDESNNTPARIDRNELWIDVAIQPVKAVEFIYIPVRIFNTGEEVSGTGV